MKCVYCQQFFAANVSLAELFSFRIIRPKELCLTCQHLFTKNNRFPRCSGCDKPAISGYCADCQYWQKCYPEINMKHESLFCYDEALHDWFQQYKFKGDINLARSFSSDLARYFAKQAAWLIIPIPLSKKRLKSRGFNQVEELLKRADVSYQLLLKKKLEDGTQSSKTRKARLQTKQSFYLPKENVPLIANKQVLLVDDVYTTGRTMMHARQCIKSAGPKAIKTVSLAR